MPRYLYLLRHAESQEKQIGQADKDRMLTQQGVRDVLLLGSHLRQQKVSIDVIFSSIAERAHTTAQLLADSLKIDPDKLVLEDELYDASVRTFLHFIQSIEDEYHHIVCVAHNPTISYLAEYLTKAEIGSMVPAGLSMIKINGASWKDVQEHSCELQDYVYPELLNREYPSGTS